MTEEYRKYLQSPEWAEKKRQVYKRALRNANSNNLHGVCEACGYQPWKPCLQIHHKTYEHIFNEQLDDLILLCPNCHKKEGEKKIMSKKDLAFEIKKHLAVLSTTNGYQKQANLISWNGKPECLDIRTWNVKDGLKPLKGIGLNADELRVLKSALDSLPELAGQDG